MIWSRSSWWSFSFVSLVRWCKWDDVFFFFWRLVSETQPRSFPRTICLSFLSISNNDRVLDRRNAFDEEKEETKANDTITQTINYWWEEKFVVDSMTIRFDSEWPWLWRRRRRSDDENDVFSKSFGLIESKELSQKIISLALKFSYLIEKIRWWSNHSFESKTLKQMMRKLSEDNQQRNVSRQHFSFSTSIHWEVVLMKK